MRAFVQTAVTAWMLSCSTVAYAEADALEAFTTHAEFMTGGVWVSKNKNGDVLVDKHVASKSKKFVHRHGIQRRQELD